MCRNVFTTQRWSQDLRTYIAAVGLFLDETSIPRAAEALNVEPSIKAEPHMDGSPLPASHVIPDVTDWNDMLGYTGESSDAAATFDWKQNAAAAAYAGEVPDLSQFGSASHT